MISCTGLSKCYGRKYALQGFQFTFAPGHIYALLGPNGSGKSTLMKTLAGLVKPDAGEVYVNDHPLSYLDKATIAYMPTEPYFYTYMRAIDAAKYYNDFFDDFSMEKFHQFMQAMGLDPMMKLRAYSTGMLAKFKVALNVSRNPQLLMLDEPLNGIDMIAREEVTAGIVHGLNRNSTVIISSHLIEDLEGITDYVLIIKEGRLIVAGETARFREQYGKSMTDMYREIFGAPILFGNFGAGQSMFGAPGMAGQNGFGAPGMAGQNGFRAPGMAGQNGFGAPGMAGQNGFGAPGMVGQNGFGAPGMAGQNGFGVPGMAGQNGYGTPGAPGQYGPMGRMLYAEVEQPPYGTEGKKDLDSLRQKVDGEESSSKGADAGRTVPGEKTEDALSAGETSDGTENRESGTEEAEE